jgi:hypothetical protein
MVPDLQKKAAGDAPKGNPVVAGPWHKQHFPKHVRNGASQGHTITFEAWRSLGRPTPQNVPYRDPVTGSDQPSNGPDRLLLLDGSAPAYSGTRSN